MATVASVPKSKHINTYNIYASMRDSNGFEVAKINLFRCLGSDNAELSVEQLTDGLAVAYKTLLTNIKVSLSSCYLLEVSIIYMKELVS